MPLQALIFYFAVWIATGIPVTFYFVKQKDCKTVPYFPKRLSGDITFPGGAETNIFLTFTSSNVNLITTNLLLANVNVPGKDSGTKMEELYRREKVIIIFNK